MAKTIIGVMGVGNATPEQLKDAEQLGAAIAQAGWVLLTGGRAAGVMEAASRGAKSAGGLTLGILPGGDRRQASEYVDLVICTDLGNGRNNINVLSSEVVIAVGMGMGTASEIALALKNHRPVILLKPDPETHAFFQKYAGENLHIAGNVQGAIAQVATLLSADRP